MYIQMFYKNPFCHIIRKKEEIMAKTSNLVVRLEPEIKERLRQSLKRWEFLHPQQSTCSTGR